MFNATNFFPIWFFGILPLMCNLMSYFVVYKILGIIYLLLIGFNLFLWQYLGSFSVHLCCNLSFKPIRFIIGMIVWLEWRSIFSTSSLPISLKVYYINLKYLSYLCVLISVCIFQVHCDGTIDGRLS